MSYEKIMKKLMIPLEDYPHVTLKPMVSMQSVVKESDTKGGSGANFLVQWRAETAVNEPIMEGVMISAAGQQGISFTSRGKALRNK